jgi:hypothetical protein
MAGRLLRMNVPSEDMRVVDLVVLPVAVIVAVVVAIPILVATTVAAYGVFSVLTAVGVAEATAGVVIPVLGFGGGLVVVAIVLLRISRRLPSAIRSLVYEGDTEVSDARPSSGDPAADPATFVARLSAADATLAAREPGETASEASIEPTQDSAFRP